MGGESQPRLNEAQTTDTPQVSVAEAGLLRRVYSLTLNVRHVVLAAVCVPVLAIVAFMR